MWKTIPPDVYSASRGLFFLLPIFYGLVHYVFGIQKTFLTNKFWCIVIQSVYSTVIVNISFSLLIVKCFFISTNATSVNSLIYSFLLFLIPYFRNINIFTSWLVCFWQNINTCQYWKIWSKSSKYATSSRKYWNHVIRRFIRESNSSVNLS